MTDTANCPKCGHPHPADAGDCENCGITFDIYEAEKSRADAEERTRVEAEAQKKAREESLVPCPKCKHLNDPLTADCLKCGIVFIKYYDSMKEDLAEDPDKADELAALESAITRHEAMKVKRRKDLEEETKRKEAEERRRLEELRKERERQEKLRKEKEEKERQERERQEALRREQEEKERQERERQEALKHEQEEKARQAALKREQEEKEQLAALTRELEEKERQERERRDALAREKAEKSQQEALKRESEEKAEMAALQQEVAAKQQSEEELAREEARRMEILSQLVKPKGTLKKLLKTYADQMIGMNYDNPTMVKEVKLASINDDHISVVAEAEGLVYTFPLTAILSIVEGIDGVTTGSTKTPTTFPLIIRVSHRTI